MNIRLMSIKCSVTNSIIIFLRQQAPFTKHQKNNSTVSTRIYPTEQLFLCINHLESVTFKPLNYLGSDIANFRNFTEVITTPSKVLPDAAVSTHSDSSVIRQRTPTHKAGSPVLSSSDNVADPNRASSLRSFDHFQSKRSN